MTPPVLAFRDIAKSFFGVPVLTGISFDVHRGRVHGLVGENGAGKSTLMKILAGVHIRDGGEVLLDGEPVHFTHPIQAMDAGVATVFQEFNLLPDRSVAENIWLAREPRSGWLVDTAGMITRTGDLLKELAIDFIDPRSRVGTLSVAEQQIVEIAKALSYDARVITMDEPTAALADHEVALLYDIIRRLRDRGVAILYVSHRLKEIFDLCDDITVLKDGLLVSSGPAGELDNSELVRRMVGRSITTYFPPPLEGTTVGDVRLEVHGGGNDFIDGIDLAVRAGEIVGVAGLQGSGRTELAEAVFGTGPFTRGEVEVDGERLRLTDPRTAIRHGMALITEDRKATGLSQNQSVIDNALLAIRAVFPSRTSRAKTTVPDILSTLRLTARSPRQEVQFLSGGNQQKVVLAKWLTTEPGVVIFDEPTRGIDVGAKIAVYDLIRQLALDGVAILLISSELPELLGIADRIVVLHDGRISADLPPTVDEETLLAAATGTLAEAS